MRYAYSVLRFVPDPVRGEFVNVGAVAGSDESSEWDVRTVENLRRARAIDEKGLLALVWSFVDEIGRHVDAQKELIENGLEIPATHVSEEWLHQLSESSQNVVQLSAPAVIAAETIDEAMRILFEQFILEPAARRFEFRKKNVALAAVRRAYRERGLFKGQHFLEGATVRGRDHKERFDFIVGNGRAHQLAQTWSFQIPSQEDLSEAIKAWAWTVRDIREHGGNAQVEQRRLTVPADVDVQVVYVPPAPNGPTATLEEALAAFAEINVHAVPTGQAGEVGTRATELLGGDAP